LKAKRKLLQTLANACIAQGLHPWRTLFLSSALSLQLSDIVGKMPAQYAARVMLVRFLYPTWFIDEVEITVSASTWHQQASSTSGSGDISPDAELALRQLLHALGFRPFYYVRSRAEVQRGARPRRRLTQEEVAIADSPSPSSWEPRPHPSHGPHP